MDAADASGRFFFRTCRAAVDEARGEAAAAVGVVEALAVEAGAASAGLAEAAGSAVVEVGPVGEH